MRVTVLCTRLRTNVAASIRDNILGGRKVKQLQSTKSRSNWFFSTRDNLLNHDARSFISHALIYTVVAVSCTLPPASSYKIT